MPPHKLLISLKLKPPSQYRKFLANLETIAGKETKFIVDVRNIGSKPTPKGKIIFEMERPTGFAVFSESAEPKKIPRIAPKGTTQFSTNKAVAAPGVWFFTAQVKLEGKERVAYYQSENLTPDYDRWVRSFYVADRHILDLNVRMQKLLEKERR